MGKPLQRRSRAGEEQVVASTSTGGDLLSQIRPAPVRAQSREWERRNRARTFRGVAPGAHQGVVEVARAVGCAVDEAAQALLEFGLVEYGRGKVAIEPVLEDGDRTLLPGKKVVWEERTWGVKPPSRKAKVKAVERKPWQDWPRVAYRLSEEVAAGIDAIRKGKAARAGEVVTLLLGHGLEAWSSGYLVIRVE